MKRAARKPKQKAWGSFDREKGRKTALKALGSLRRLKGQMAADPKVSEVSISQMAYALGTLEDCINSALPEHSQVHPLTGLFEEDEKT
jgi:hypothetical protein